MEFDTLPVWFKKMYKVNRDITFIFIRGNFFMYQLRDEELVRAYEDAKYFSLDMEFIELLEKEITRRRLVTHEDGRMKKLY